MRHLMNEIMVEKESNSKHDSGNPLSRHNDLFKTRSEFIVFLWDQADIEVRLSFPPVVFYNSGLAVVQSVNPVRRI